MLNFLCPYIRHIESLVEKITHSILNKITMVSHSNNESMIQFLIQSLKSWAIFYPNLGGKDSQMFATLLNIPTRHSELVNEFLNFILFFYKNFPLKKENPFVTSSMIREQDVPESHEILYFAVKDSNLILSVVKSAQASFIIIRNSYGRFAWCVKSLQLVDDPYANSDAHLAFEMLEEFNNSHAEFCAQVDAVDKTADVLDVPDENCLDFVTKWLYENYEECKPLKPKSTKDI